MANPNTYGSDYHQTAKVSQERPATADALDSAVSALSNAASELAGITDKLCGSVPVDGASKLRGVSDGHFSQIDQSRNDIETITESILDNVRRIRGRM